MKVSMKVISVWNTEIPRGYVPINKIYELKEDCKDVLFELIYSKRNNLAKEIRNYVELESFQRIIEILEDQKWSKSIKYALHAARILAALPADQQKVRPVVGVWRA